MSSINRLTALLDFVLGFFNESIDILNFKILCQSTSLKIGKKPHSHQKNLSKYTLIYPFHLIIIPSGTENIRRDNIIFGIHSLQQAGQKKIGQNKVEHKKQRIGLFKTLL